MPVDVTSSAERYHLAFIDVETLVMDTVPVGEDLPRYAVMPDGRSLVLDNAYGSEAALRILDVSTPDDRAAGSIWDRRGGSESCSCQVQGES